ncbi:hypothetical protein CLOP_g24151 [Closterium sp. NIES-67]|nr:hypothetical protein CLOP_g24151 [Closterium sp. NIES-67]
MRALYDLVPNARNTDTASMLDEAIQYVRTLQEQVQAIQYVRTLQEQVQTLKKEKGESQVTSSTLKKEKGESQVTSSVGTGSMGRAADSNNEDDEGGSRSAGQQSLGQAGYGGADDGFGSENEVWEGSAQPSPMGSGMGSRKDSLQLLSDRQGSGDFGGVGREVGDVKVDGGFRGVGVGVEGYVKAEPESDDLAAPQELEQQQQQQQQHYHHSHSQQQHHHNHHHRHHHHQQQQQQHHALDPSGSDLGATAGMLAAGGSVDGVKGSNHGDLVTEAAAVTGLESMIVGATEVEWPGEIELTLEDMNMVDLGGWDFDS